MIGGKVSMEKVYFLRTFLSLVSNISEKLCVHIRSFNDIYIYVVPQR